MAKLDPFRSPQARARFIEKYDAVVADWPVACEERDLRTEFGTTHVIVSGPESAPPLVLLHGAGATALMWRSRHRDAQRDVPLLLRRHDHRGQQEHCHQAEPRKDQARRVVAPGVRGARHRAGEGRRPSYGGWLAANLAVQSPELVNRLVLLCPAATFAPITLEFYRGVFSANLRHSPERARRFIQWLSSTPNVESDPAADLIVTALLSGKSIPTGLTPPTVLSDDTLRRISAPTTVVIGDREVIYRGGPRAALARAQKLIPDVQTHLMPGANHMLTIDCPEELSSTLAEALV